MGPQAQFRVAAEGPVVDFETQLKGVRRNDAVVAWIDQPQGRGGAVAGSGAAVARPPGGATSWSFPLGLNLAAVWQRTLNHD